MTHHHHFTLQTADLTVMCRCRQTRQVCKVCRSSFARIKEMCALCYEYQRRNGRPRPLEAIEAHARRLLDPLSRSA